MSNPVLSRRGLFTPAQPQYVAPAQGLDGNAGMPPAGGFPGQGYTVGNQAYAAYGQPGYQAGPATGWAPPAQAVERMTIDDVLSKTAISLGMLFLVAASAFYFLPLQILYPVGLVGGLAAFIAPFLVVRRRVANPVGNIVYAIAEGLLIGALTKLFEMYYPGIAIQAVLGTLVTAGVVLVAYRFGGFRVSSKMAKIVRVGMIGFVMVAAINLILFFFNINLGLFPGPGQPVSILAWLLALVGVGLAVFSLVEDFQFVEAGVRMGAPRSQGWLAAFGLSVTMVWLYVNLLRLLSYIRR